MLNIDTEVFHAKMMIYFEIREYSQLQGNLISETDLTFI